MAESVSIAPSSSSPSPYASFRQFYDSFPDSQIASGFQCIDNAANLETLLESVRSSLSTNFVLDFCDDTAWAASDLSTSSMAQLMEAGGPVELHARWVNIWSPSQSKSTLEYLARRYDFSPRLLALMCSDPRAVKMSGPAQAPPSSHAPFWKPSSRTREVDLEMDHTDDDVSEISSTESYESTRGNLYRITHEMWHYTSVDFGRQYVCIGYNSLYNTTPIHYPSPEESPLPGCLRLWTWLILCEDNTVLTIHEDPFPFQTHTPLTPTQRHLLVETRRSPRTIIHSLSSLSSPSSSQSTPNPFTLLPIRHRLGHTPEETAHRATDSPSLLFYYLFESWPNSYTLITRKESRYGPELSLMRAEMFELPRLQHIDRLDRIGRELGVLKRHYTAYNRVIRRLLEPEGVSLRSLENSRVVVSTEAGLDPGREGFLGEEDEREKGEVVVMAKESMLGVPLSSPAKARFRRLKDLIDLYALSEVDEYLKQKEALVAMNFNLIAIKESFDVEKLTRITLLLTKATFLFLPVSFMTGYFSVPLAHAEHTVSQYWVAFAVTLFASWLAMVVFGVFSGDVSTAVFFHQTWKGMVRFGMWVGRKMQR